MAAFSSMKETPSPGIEISEEWSAAADTIAKSFTRSLPPTVFICGAKNSGKTTFSRYLLNTFLPRYKSVAYLDTDVGQPEFTPPGCLSLTIIDEETLDLTIPCLKTPQRCYFFGDVSSKRDPETYLNCIYALYDHYRKDLRISCKSGSPGAAELPLIINTPGWVKGLGFDILVDILKHIAATHVVKINISSGEKNLPSGAFWLDDLDECSVNLVEITPARKDSYNRSVLVQKKARLIRELRLMAYFRQCFPSSMSITTIKELALALASLTPYQVPISSIKIRHLHCEVPNSEVFYSLNATIVGLAVSCEDSQSLPVCVGLGIVRGIDTLKNVIYLITPVPQSILAGVDLLLQGYIQIPTGLLQVQGCMSPYMSANVVTVQGLSQ
ncbi:polynucleotide 5'-hydroxyl-kinase NOL9-like [Chenopodium quinoa]|uniref:Polynucleotide 5'-hydroxyl-kinase NOL9 n=1 Tax=Chenopodium quinoa TaxID=63459 RepID=A0A803M1F2_CHEQI|nr:polynucleotide 5'-hydroxyl-kinase NOL9-like [Chenopodium quinoa]XP_021761726.1 polynucleotide 5'-hydroxyl-kinase NOL9-like [Chenopodium quinoa]